jgi:putative ABC transport system permease protein
MMLFAALRDLQWRRRRVVTAVAGTALVCGLTLLMTGVSNGFRTETVATVRDLGADGWVVRDGASGPFLGSTPMEDTLTADIAALPGVEAAGPVVFTRKSVRSESGSESDVNVFGGVGDGAGMPAADEGRQPTAPDEVMISDRLHGYDLGDTVEIAGTDLEVVGKVHGSTAFAGTPNVFLDIKGAQVLGFAGLPVASAIAVRGTPASLPDGLELSTNAAARADLLRAIEKAKSTIVLVTVLLWIVAASIIGAVVYLSVLERQRDFAVFKATGVATRSILAGLALQAAILAVIAALGGSVVGLLLAPRFPMIVALELRAHLFLPVVATAIGLLASLVGLRRVVTIDPALAFGGP